MHTSQNLPEHVAKAILARATELDATSPTMSVDELRAIAAEINVSSASLEAALREHQRAVLSPAAEGSRVAPLVSALGLPLGAVAGAALSTAPLFTAGPILSAVTAAGLLSSGALLILQSRRPSLRSYIAQNGALWGGVIAGGLASIAILGSGAALELPWLVIVASGVKNWLSSTVLGSAAVIAIRRAGVGKSGKPGTPLIASGEGERTRLQSLRERVLGRLDVWRRIERHGWSWTRFHNRAVATQTTALHNVGCS